MQIAIQDAIFLYTWLSLASEFFFCFGLILKQKKTRGTCKINEYRDIGFNGLIIENSTMHVNTKVETKKAFKNWNSSSIITKAFKPPKNVLFCILFFTSFGCQTITSSHIENLI